MSSKPVAWRRLAAAFLGGAIAALVLSGAAAAPAAGRDSERNRQKRGAEEQRAQLQQKLTALKQSIDRNETEKQRAADSLAQSEAAISEANRSLADLAAEQGQTEKRLADLTRQLRELQAALALRQKQLSTVLREQYVSGNEDRIQLLLSGDDPSRINRALQYMGYVSKAQGKLIESMRISLAAIERNQAEATEAAADLNDIATESQQQKRVLEQQKTQRAQLLAQYASRLASQRAEVGRLQKDESRLGGLVEQLGKLIEAQQKAEQIARAERERVAKAELAAREKRRQQAALARREASGSIKTPSVRDSAKDTGTGTARSQINNPDAIDADEPPAVNATKVIARNEPPSESSAQGVTSLQPFASLKGRLRWPLKGDLMARFGARREDGPSWKGLFIRAAEGSEVHAVAGGRVVFAEWLRGFGNLIIVDHGTQYMTIYGNNQAVLKHAGDSVAAGDVIASAGNTGGNAQSGLYFEMRFQGRAFDPLGWVTGLATSR